MKRSYYEEAREIMVRNSPGRIAAPIRLCDFTERHSKPSIINRIKTRFKRKPKNTNTEHTMNISGNAGVGVLTSFSGCDMVVMVNNKVIGELQSIFWYEPSKQIIANTNYDNYVDGALAKQYPVVCQAVFAVFDKDNVQDLNDANIFITYANEYGQSSYRAIFDVIVVNKTSGSSVDSIVLEETVLLAAKSMSPLKRSLSRVGNIDMKELANLMKEVKATDGEQ